jgi:hypothetical protein
VLCLDRPLEGGSGRRPTRDRAATDAVFPPGAALRTGDDYCHFLAGAPPAGAARRLEQALRSFETGYVIVPGYELHARNRLVMIAAEGVEGLVAGGEGELGADGGVILVFFSMNWDLGT